jgi:hypothetical protein
MGIKLRNLAAALSIHAWKTLSELVRSVNPEDVRGFINTLKEWRPQDSIDTVRKAAAILGDLAAGINHLMEFVDTVMERFKLLGAEMERREAGGRPGISAAPESLVGRFQDWWEGRGWGAGARRAGIQRAATARAANMPYRAPIGGTREGVPVFRGARGTPESLANIPIGDLSRVAPRAYERRRGERGEFNAAALGEFGPPDPSGRNQVMVTLNNGQRVRVHRAVAERFQGFLNEAINRGYPVNVSGGFNYRQKRGGGGLSQHSWGTAVDINVNQNPFRGRTTDMPEGIEALAWKHGLSWGGRFGDPMHFEAMGQNAWGSKLAQLGVAPDQAKMELPPVNEPLSVALAPRTAGQMPGGVAGGALRTDTTGQVAPEDVRRRAEQLVTSSGLAGYVPPGGERYGIRTGAPHEWANYFTALAGAESSFRPGLANVSARERAISAGAGSHGLFQISPQDARNYGLQQDNFSMDQLRDPETNLRATIAMHEQLAKRGGFSRGGVGAYWGPIRSGQLQVGPSPGSVLAAEQPPPEQARKMLVAGQTESVDALARSREADEARERLTAKPPENVIKEGTAAGEAAARAFKQGIEDVKIPVKSPGEEDKERDKRRADREKEAA